MCSKPCPWGPAPNVCWCPWVTAAWGEGQLETELGENSWLTVAADQPLIFDTPVDQRYDRRWACLGLQSWMISTTSGARMSDADVPLFLLHLTTFIAFDFGLKRTGVAVGNRLMRTAQPQGSIHAEGNARFDGVAAKLKEWQPDAIVIGVPYHPDGAPHENTARAKKFGRQLQGRFRSASV